MNVDLMTMPPEQAREKLRAYRADRHKDAEAEYAACAEAYAHLAQGTPLINLREAIIGGGTFDSGLPRLAIARADRKEIKCEARRQSFEFDARAKPGWGQHFPELVLRFQFDNDPERPHYKAGWSLVPMVPADVRPETGQLRNWFILWEVESWSDGRAGSEPDRDPLLLKHIGGELYAVIAEWDLTDLERAVMAGAMQG